MLTKSTDTTLRKARHLLVERGELPPPELVGATVLQSWSRYLNAGLVPIGAPRTRLALKASSLPAPPTGSTCLLPMPGRSWNICIPKPVTPAAWLFLPMTAGCCSRPWATPIF